MFYWLSDDIDKFRTPCRWWRHYHILEAKSAKLVYPHSFITLAFRNRLEYRNADGVLIATMVGLHYVEIWWVLVQ